MHQKMDKKPLIDFIKRNIPNIPISEERIQIIASFFEEREIVAKSHLLKAGQVSGYFYLHKGFIRAYTYDADGIETTTYFYPSERVVFDASSFFLSQPSTEYFQALCDCTGFFTTFDKLNALFHSVPEFREFGRAILVKEFASYKQRTLSMINKSAEDRYADLVMNQKEILQFAPLKYIASYLGITDTSLSRIRREFIQK